MSDRSPRNFRSYAAIEAANIVLLPAAALILAPPTRIEELASLVVASAACGGFLLVGALFWRALDQRLKRAGRSSMIQALTVADRLEMPLLLLSAAAAAALVYAVSIHGLTWPLVAAAILTLLAGLEYINYYHRQLQHFDRWNDFKRLVTTGRLRPSHMARALAAHRQGGTMNTPHQTPRNTIYMRFAVLAVVIVVIWFVVFQR